MEVISQENRWEIKKIGLLNYWWYDEEEFEFSDGRLILRGTNGSGKSVTMQSFIPLLLDGNKSPERLDPFNTRARKIEDYILGYGDDIKDENTSYLYMEFCKKQTKQYLTIGMGLRAKKNNGVTFWGFLINDGRRIGKDFYLYKDIGNKIPLTKAELKNRIGEGGQVVDTTNEYAMMVNNNIFGFESLAEYQEFIKLLIEIRTPKLSKDGFKPSIITEIMSNSLRGLSDEDLKAVSESIENMNKTKEQLESLQISEKALKQIMTPYENYNKYVLYSKAKKYDDRQKKYLKTQKENSEISNNLSENKDSLKEKEEQKQRVENEIEVNEYKKQELENNEIWKQKQEQTNMKKELEELEIEMKKNEEQEENKKQIIRRKEDEEKNSKENIEEEKANFETVNNEMEQIARKIEYDEYFFKMDEIKLNKKYDYKYFKEDIKRYISKIEEGKKALEKENIISREYEASLQNLDMEKREKENQEEITTKSRNELQETKENFIEEMYKWEKENEILKLETEEMGAISRKVQNYGENAEYGDIILSLNVPYNGKTQKLLNEKASKNALKQNKEIEIKEKKEQIEEWKNKKEPEPVLSDKIRLNRKKLKEKNVPFIEFYNAVDFKSDLKDETKNRIESALNDMGILNAIIIPKEYREKIGKIDVDFVDKYLYEKPVEFKYDLSNLLDVKLPQNTNIKPETVVNVLKSIMIEDNSADTYLNENGEYKIGILQGISDKDEKAKFIGFEARKEYKLNQIQKLEDEKEALENEKEIIIEEIESIDLKITKLEEEYNKFPKKDELEAAYSKLRVNINKLTSINENIEKLEKIQIEKFEKLKEAKEEVKVKTMNLRFNLSLEAYEESFELANELKDLIFDMEKYHTNYINEFEKLQGITETLSDLNYDLEEILGQKVKITIKMQNLKGKIQSIEQMLKDTDLEKQMEECQEKLNILPKEEKRLIAEIATLEAEIRKLEENAISLENRLSSFEKQTELTREIFKQELDLKYVISEYEDLNKTMKNILDIYNYFDKDNRNIQNYYENLVGKYRENSENLLDYNLGINDIFVKEINEKNDEMLEIEQTRRRSDISCLVNGRKINLNDLKKYIEESIEETKNLVDDEDRHLFEEILIGAVGRKIRERIYFAKDWVESMNKLMKSLNTSSGLSFSLNWKPKLATDESEIDTKEIVDILNSDAALLKQSDIKKVATHFRSKFAKAEKEFAEKNATIPFYSIIKEALDYRKWFEFQFMFKKSGEQSRELTNNAFYKLSGGEKAMAMYIPLFASVCARYQSAKKDCLRIISLDEAFAGVDDNNIRDMFRILTELDLEFVINSQVLWGEYDTVPSLSICELISDVNLKVVSVMRYHWNGEKRELVI